MTVADPADLSLDVCYRCGYELRGIADEQPCPECGLLAIRSRRPSDELHHTRPGWLRRLAWGVRLILLALLIGVASPFAGAWLESLVWEFYPPPLFFPASSRMLDHAPLVFADLAAVVLLAGVLLLTSREGYPPADRADRWRRRLLRFSAAIPLLGMLILHIAAEAYAFARALAPWATADDNWAIVAFIVLTVGCIPLPILLFLQLRSLARRARSAHLAEHCAIVGIGNALTLLYVPVVVFIVNNADRWGLGPYWTTRSSAALALVAVLAVSAALFALWNLYLLVRFAIAFSRASHLVHTQWTASDRATAA